MGLSLLLPFYNTVGLLIKTYLRLIQNNIILLSTKYTWPYEQKTYLLK